jgi:hypothetical protein
MPRTGSNPHSFKTKTRTLPPAILYLKTFTCDKVEVFWLVAGFNRWRWNANPLWEIHDEQ